MLPDVPRPDSGRPAGKTRDRPPEAPVDERLVRWGENVGAPVSRDFALEERPSCAAGHPRGGVLVVLSWNVWIGRGRLREVVGRIRSGGYSELGAPAEAPLVALVQEAYRCDDSVPSVSSGWAPRVRPRHFRPEEDVVEVARELRLNVRYVPSMRNGSHRSDRGNALLSTLPLGEVIPVQLPFVIQRRVAVTATAVLASDGGGGPTLRLCSAHLDPWGAVGRDWLGVAGRALQARSLLEAIGRGAPGAEDDLPVVLGADLNTSRGRREAAYRLLLEEGFTSGIPHRDPVWAHTYHMVPRLPIDYLLFRFATGAVRSATVHRLSENPRDAGPTVFGSDHHPLLARVELEPASVPTSTSGESS